MVRTVANVMAVRVCATLRPGSSDSTACSRLRRREAACYYLAFWTQGRTVCGTVMWLVAYVDGGRAIGDAHGGAERRAAAAAPRRRAGHDVDGGGISRWRRHSGEVQPGGARRGDRRGAVARDQLDQRAGRHAVVLPQHARHGRRPQQDHRRPGALGRLEHSRNRHRPARRRAEGPKLANGAISSARPARCTAGRAPAPTARSTTTCSSSMRWTRCIDVQPAADAFETRANVMKAIQGHVSERPSTAGCSGVRSSAPTAAGPSGGGCRVGPHSDSR